MSATMPYPRNTGAGAAGPYFAVAPVDEADARAERTLFGLALLAAALGLALGVMMMVWPDATLAVVAVLFGAWLLVHGAVRVIQAIAGFGADTGARVLAGVVGVLFVVAGVASLRNLLTSLAIVATLIGIAWLVGGFVELGLAFVAAGGAGQRIWTMVVPGAVSVLGGVVVLVWPAISLVAMVYFVGAWLVLMGIIQLVIVLRAHRALAAT